MPSNPSARCQQIRTNGTQCGSPALRNQKFCYYHQENRPQPYILCVDNEWYEDSRLVMPVFEDAHSIQVVIRQIMQLLVAKRIEQKTAGLLLYAIQIASANLKRMDQEKPQPAQVVVDPDKVAETPLETAPPSANPSDEPAKKRTQRKSKKDGPSEEQIQRDLDALVAMGKHLYDSAPVSTAEIDLAESIARRADACGLTPEAIEHRRKLALDSAERRENVAGRMPDSSEESDSSNDALPPGTIQACVRKPSGERRPTYVI